MKVLLKTLLLLALTVASNLINAADVSKENVAGAVTVDAEKDKKLFDEEVLFINVRKDKDWEAGRIPGAEHLELKKVYNEEALAELAGKYDKIVLYCNGGSCLRSEKASALAVKWGYKKVHYFRAGYPAWKANNYPTE